MKNLDKSCFRFYIQKAGIYKVVYTSPNSGKEYSGIVTDMELIDATKNEDEPSLEDLKILKDKIKKYQSNFD